MIAAKKQWALEWVKQPKSLYIGGAWSPGHSKKTLSTINPANGEVLGLVADASAEDVGRAVAAAQAGFKAWSNTTRKVRRDCLIALGKLIRDHHAELATLETLDNGKTYPESFADDIPEAADIFDYYAGWIDKIYGETAPVEAGFLNFTRREPLGVCALIVPWNFPLLLACWKIAPALAMGNSVIVKPSPFTPHSSLRLAEIVQEAGLFPPGVFNVVTGGIESGEALSAHAGVAKLSFTGSTAVGKKIVEQVGRSTLKSLSLELGGKSPNIVFADAANLDAVIHRAFTAMFSHKGEKCSEPTRLLLESSLYPRALEQLADKAAKVICGDPFDPGTTQGPQCHQAHFQKVMDYIRIGKEEGARLVAGGDRDTRGTNGKGYFVRPTIFADVTPKMRIAQEEIFGPVLVVSRFQSEPEAIAQANDSAYGLAAGVYTSDISRAHRVANALDAGMVFVNHYGCYDFASPFGGFKQSGWGKELAIHSLDAYTRTKSVWIKYET